MHTTFDYVRNVCLWKTFKTLNMDFNALDFAETSGSNKKNKKIPQIPKNVPKRRPINKKTKKSLVFDPEARR